MNNKDLKYWIGFSFIPGIGRVRLGYLESYFGSLEAAWQAGAAELKNAHLDDTVIKAVASWRPNLHLEEELEKMKREGVQALIWHDEKYPARLKEIYDYPPILYIKGEILPEDEWC